MTLEYTDYEPYDFANRRHIGPSPAEMAEMLEVVGADSLDALIEQTVPAGIRQKAPLDWGRPLTERGTLDRVRETANKNRVLTSLIGQGYHGTILPPAIQRNILENPAWYTAYTPYQPEISQGRLEALLNFQTLVTDLTAMEIANSSLLDEATACAEAMTMAHRQAKSKARAFFVDQECHPQNLAVMRTRAEPLGIEIVVGDPVDLDAAAVFGAIFQYPGTHGHIMDFSRQIAALHEAGALGIVSADPLALCLLKPPGEMGADIVVGSMQRFGVPMGYGGPHAAYMATRDAHKRAMPGRLVGVSVDARGNRAYRLSLQTREQHIRREKATSNICTAQVLLAVIAGMYAVFHGPRGLKAIAERVHRKAAGMVEGLEGLGFPCAPKAFFDTITVEVGPYQGLILKNANDQGLNFRKVGEHRIGITVDERTRPETVEAVWRAFGGFDLKYPDKRPDDRLPRRLVRQSGYLDHPIFHMNRAESEMTRYMRRLADRDLALDRSMIPLGSCTMKLNATVEMLPITWPEFAELHPFVPANQAEGYAELIGDLADKLCAITGYDAFSMQPNSGAQGEYAGLMVIRAYHASRGEAHRDVCLIPSSAHGTNPASAQMAGMKVVVVRTDDHGNIDMADFRAKAEDHRDRLAAVMVTYPSTHGVFEEIDHGIVRDHPCLRRAGLHGRRQPQRAGRPRPAGRFRLGRQPPEPAQDVLHPAWRRRPRHGADRRQGASGALPAGACRDGWPDRGGEVSAAPYGSAGILPISWAYCLAMGGEGLTQATRVAILNANYIAKRLEGAYDVLYKGRNGRVAHECIVDTRPLQKSAGVTVDDVAKRLIDCGFHAPTMSWPVAGTLMIEPTESEDKAELDRFCDAMLAIREEARAIERGEMDAQNNPLKNAPHTVEDLVGEWDRPYSREQACFPPGAFRVDKYWPPVNRVDNVFGDRHLVCTCPPVEAYAEAAE